MSILQEALLEAGQIKEAAKQQAEREIIEKHSKELKKRVEGILTENFSFMEADEEEEDPMADLDAELDMGGDAGGMDMGGGDEFEDDVEYVDDSDLSGMDSQIPYSFASGEKMCPCAEDDEEIEIDFDELMSMAGSEGDPGADEFGSHEDLAGAVGGGGGEVEDDELDLQEFSLEEMLKEFLGDEEAEAEEDEEEVNEDLEVDVSPRPSGWSPRNEKEWKEEKVKQDIVAKHGKDPVEEKEGALSGNVPDVKPDKYKKMYEDLMARLNEARSAKKAETQKNVLLENKNTKYKTMLKDSLDGMETVLLENTILKHQNMVLSNNSLNERQKIKYVDALGNAKTVEDVKKVYSIIDSGSPSQSVKTPIEKLNVMQEAMKKRPSHSQRLGTKPEPKAEGDGEGQKMPASWQKIINKK